MKRSSKIISTLALSLLLQACASAPSGRGPVNDLCPIMNKPVKTTITTVYKGETIGFCCKGCIKKWNAKEETVKDAMLKSWKGN